MGLLGLRRGVRSDCSKWLTTVFPTVASTPSSMGRRTVAVCHHRACGRTFSGLAAFDAHLSLLRSAPWSVCVDPATLNTPLRHVEGVWRLPTPERVENRLEATR